jgi:hypothetical protein
VTVSYESVRRWCLRFGGDFARGLRRRRPRPGDTWLRFMHQRRRAKHDLLPARVLQAAYAVMSAAPEAAESPGSAPIHTRLPKAPFRPRPYPR